VLLISDGSKPTPAKTRPADGAAAQVLPAARWLNPLLRYEGFEARPAGIKAMLPHVDDFCRCTIFDSLTRSRQRSERRNAAAFARER
jgi:uncharacterized protein with von Willebrand factor type A (vWA) domain